MNILKIRECFLSIQRNTLYI